MVNCSIKIFENRAASGGNAQSIISYGCAKQQANIIDPQLSTLLTYIVSASGMVERAEIWRISQVETDQ